MKGRGFSDRLRSLTPGDFFVSQFLRDFASSNRRICPFGGFFRATIGSEFAELTLLSGLFVPGGFNLEILLYFSAYCRCFGTGCLYENPIRVENLSVFNAVMQT